MLNEWAAKDLGAAVGDPLSVDYYVWETEGRLRTQTADFASRASCRSRARPPIAIWCLSIPASPTRIAWPTGIRRFRSILKRVRPVDEAVLEPLSRDAEGVHSDRARAGVVGLASRRADRAAADSAGRDVRSRTLRAQYENALRGRARSAGDGIFRVRRARAESRRVERRDRFRRVLHVFQHLPRRVGAAAGGVVLQARRRAAAAGSRAAAGARAGSAGDSTAVCGRGARPRGHRRRCGHRRRDRLQRAHHARPPHVVGRRGWYDGADAARRPDVAHRRRARRGRRSPSHRSGGRSARWRPPRPARCS